MDPIWPLPLDWPCDGAPSEAVAPKLRSSVAWRQVVEALRALRSVRRAVGGRNGSAEPQFSYHFMLGVRIVRKRENRCGSSGVAAMCRSPVGSPAETVARPAVRLFGRERFDRWTPGNRRWPTWVADESALTTALRRRRGRDPPPPAPPRSTTSRSLARDPRAAARPRPWS